MQKEKLDGSRLIYSQSSNPDTAGQPLRPLADTPNCCKTCHLDRHPCLLE